MSNLLTNDSRVLLPLLFIDHYSLIITHFSLPKIRCEGRSRTFTEELAFSRSTIRCASQHLLVGILKIYPVFSAPETRGCGCQFHHLTML